MILEFYNLYSQLDCHQAVNLIFSASKLHY